MKTTREDINVVFEELGFPTAKNWNAKRLHTKIMKLPEVVGDDTKIKSQKLLNKVVAAVKAGKEIVVNEPEVCDTTPAKNPVTKKAGGKKKATPKEKAAAKKPAAKSKKAAAKKAEPKKPKKPGVIASIIEFLEKATEKKPITKKQLGAKIATRFKDRSEDSMANTINIQVPSRLRVDKGIIVEKNDKGYWIE